MRAAGSPCLDAGTDEDWMWSAVDMDGNPHILNGSIDMVAYEYVPPVFSLEIADAFRAAGAGVRLRWNS